MPKFSELTAASTLTGAEIVPVTQGGASRRTTATALAALAGAGADSGVINANAAPYSALSAASTTARRTALMDAYAAAVAQGKTLVIPAGDYQISGSPLAWTDNFVRIVGAGQERTRITQTTDGQNCVNVGGWAQQISGITFGFTNIQDATTGGNSVSITTQCYNGSYRDIGTYKGKVGLDSGTTFVFSCTFDTWRLAAHRKNAISLRRDGNTGSVLSNIYFVNKDGATTYSCTGPAIDLFGCDEMVLTQVNIEDLIMASDKCILIDQAKAVTIRGLHYERVRIGTFQADLLRVGGNSYVNVEGVSVVFCDWTDEGYADHRSLFSTDGGYLAVRGLNVKGNQRTANITNYVCNSRSASGSFKLENYITNPQLTTTSTMGTTGFTWVTGNQWGATKINGTGIAMPTLTT